MAAKARGDQFLELRIEPADVIAALLAGGLYVAGVYLLDAWHPGWLSLVVGASAAILFAWKRRRTDTAAALVSLLGGVVALILGADTVGVITGISTSGIGLFLMCPWIMHAVPPH